MKNSLKITILIMMIFTSSLFADWGMYDADRSWITINENGGSSAYTLWNSATGTFDGSNLGTYSSGHTLQITAFDVKTWKNNGGDVTGVEYFYRVYKQGESAPSFTSLGGGWIADLGGGNQKWGLASTTVDLLDGVNSAGTWVVEVYGSVTGTTPSTTIFDNNSGSNYIATFITDSSLPVELSAFTAQSNHRGVALTWITDSEIENQGFILSRKTRNTRWEEIASFSKDRALLGQGFTTDATRYAFLDSQVREGQTYSYLLSDVDYRGQQTNHERQIQTLTHVIPETPTRPGVLELTRVYPNPFNPATTLSYGLTAASDVSVNIYDLKGELVWNQTQLNQTAGADHQITWQGVNTLGQAVNSGIYLVHIQAGAERISQKVTLLR